MRLLSKHSVQAQEPLHCAKAAVLHGASISRHMPYVFVPDQPSPPPPPLSWAKENWVPLYFFLGLLAAYGLVMLAVFASFRVGLKSEHQPLNAKAPQPPPYRNTGFGELAWYNVDDSYVQANMQVDPWVRAAFVRKVYAILSTQLLATVGVTVGVIYAAFYKGDHKYPTEWGHWILGPGYYLVFLTLILAMFILCYLMVAKQRFPWNFIGLAAFTGCMSFQLSIICTLYYGSGLGSDLLLAFVLTTATFLVLTAFTIVSKIDFSFLAPLLCVGIFVVIVWSLIMSIAILFGGVSVGWYLAYSILGMILFIGFILYDTYMIVTRLGVDDYIVGAIELYLDIINLFLFILQCLTLSDRR